MLLVKNLLGRGQLLRQAPKFMRASSNFVDGGEHATANDLPVPEGDWKEAYDKKNGRYNMVLFSGIISFVGTVAFMIKSEALAMNFYVPEYPED